MLEGIVGVGMAKSKVYGETTLTLSSPHLPIKDSVRGRSDQSLTGLCLLVFRGKQIRVFFRIPASRVVAALAKDNF
jgi:hypothetical protein